MFQPVERMFEIARRRGPRAAGGQGDVLRAREDLQLIDARLAAAVCGPDGEPHKAGWRRVEPFHVVGGMDSLAKMQALVDQLAPSA